MKRIYTLNEKAFDQLTDEAAYWVGFLLADGCIYRDRSGALQRKPAAKRNAAG
jgi:hypothetical protein